MNQNEIVMTRGDDRDIDLSDLADRFVISGATVRFTICDLLTREALIDESAGDIIVSLVPADTEDAPDRRSVYRYEVEAEEQAGEIHTLRRGRFVILPDLEPVS